MGIATLSSRVLGFVREILLANIFGATGLTDAFNIAFRIPNMLRDLFAEGAFSSAFIPTFTGEKNKSEQDAINLFWSAFSVLLMITGFFSILIIIFSPEIVSIMTNENFTKDIQRFELTVLLTRIMAPFLTFVSLAALCMGVLNTYKMFFAPAMAPAIFNIIMIISMLVAPKYLAQFNIHEIVSLGIGVIVGGLLQFLIQLPMIYSKGIFKKAKIQVGTASIKQILHRLSIGSIGIAATQLNLLVSTYLATSTVVGAVSWLQYSFRLFQFPVGILGVSIGNSNLVHFSEHWKKNNKKEAVDCLQTSYLTTLFTLIPAFSILFALAYECASLSYQRGKFNSTDTMMVAQTLRYYLYGLPFYGLYKVFSPTFYTLDRPKIPVYISTISILINIVFCTLLVNAYSFQVLALGTTLSMVFIIFVQSYFLIKLLDINLLFFFPPRFFKILIAGIFCFIATSFARSYWVGDISEGALKLLLEFISCCLVGGLTYVIVLCATGDHKLVVNFFSKFLKRS